MPSSGDGITQGARNHEKQIVWYRNNRGAGLRPAGDGPGADQDRLRQHLLRPAGRDRRGHAPLGRARQGASRRQDGRQAVRDHLRGRPVQARRRQAEVGEAGPAGQGELRRRLHLVERAAGLAQDRDRRGRHHPDLVQCRPLADRGRALQQELLLDLVEQRPDADGDGPVPAGEGRQEPLPDGRQLRRRQGHARGRQAHLQGRDQGRGPHQVARPARLLGRARQDRRGQAGRHLHLLSRRARRAVPAAVRAGRA